MKRGYLAAIAWLSCLVFGSLLALNQLLLGTGVQEFPLDLADVPVLSAITGGLLIVNPHRLAHWGGFTCGALLLFAVADTVAERLGTSALLIAAAALIEAVQAWIFKAAFDWTDFFDDMLAVGCALALVSIWRFLDSVFTRRSPANGAK